MYAIGTPLVASPHAVSCSLPTIKSVVGYEEKDPAIWDFMRIGYPRFVQNPLIVQYLSMFSKQKGLGQNWDFYAVTTESVVESIKDRFSVPKGHWKVHGFHVIAMEKFPEVSPRVKAFLQHTGTQISSRQAEDALLAEGQKSSPHFEEHLPLDQAKTSVIQKIAILQKVNESAVQIATGGMNATYHLLEAIDQDTPEGVYLYIGWLYTDTLSIFRKDYSEKSRSILCLKDWEAIESAFKDPNNPVKAVLTEVPTNPLLKTIDLDRLYSLCQQNNTCLIVDASVSGLSNVCLKDRCDILVCSLTKYFGSGCDLLAGTIVYYSAKAEKWKKNMQNRLDPLYRRDWQRLGFETQKLDLINPVINHHAKQLASRLTEHPAIEKVFHPYQQDSGCQYQKLAGANAPGALISYTVKKNWQAYYDQLMIAKGPSFGVTFSMLCPYVYLAHYQEVKQHLLPPIIPPNLLRLSVGVEPLEEIWEKISTPLVYCE